MRIGIWKKLVSLVIDINKNTLSDHTERFIAAGLSLDFLNKMAKAVAALQSAGYEPYDQLYGYVMHGNDQYITRHGGARDIVKKMDVKDIKTFLKHYRLNKWKNIADSINPLPEREAGLLFIH